MKAKVTSINSLSQALSDLEPYIKNANSLRTGRKFTNFPLLPREVLGNLLLCIVGNWNHKKEILTFSDDTSGSDGCILDKTTHTIYPVEHVFIPPSKQRGGASVEDLVIAAVKDKMSKGGKAYSVGKILLIFSDVIGPWWPNRVAKEIAEDHSFEAIWAFALESGNQSVYIYNVTDLSSTEDNAPIWKVVIHFPTKKWVVNRIQ
jgi:hypothetical protein